MRSILLVTLAAALFAGCPSANDEAAGGGPPAVVADGGVSAADGSASSLDGGATSVDASIARDGAVLVDAGALADGGGTHPDAGIVVIDGGPLGSRSALDFPSNVTGSDQSSPMVALSFDDPHLHGLPFAGPSNAGVTYMWRVAQRAQTGYYVTLWWAQGDGGFTSDAQYVGGRPYPKVGNNTGTTHRWEIAAPAGGDYFDTRAGLGTSKDVVYGVWRTQALRVVRNANASKTYTFYSALPSVAADDVLEWTSGTGGDVAETPPPSPKLTIGDSPWYASYQHERLSGLFGELIISAAAKSESEILAQAADMKHLTSAFAAGVWFFKPGWRTVDDLTCEAGTGHAFHWADAAHKAALGVLP